MWSFAATVNEENSLPLRLVRRLINMTPAARLIANRTNSWAEGLTSDRDYVNIMTFPGVDVYKNIMLASDMSDLTEYEFEGRRFLGIRKYDKYLTEWYGDYMKLPPENERVSGHLTEVYLKEDN